MKISLKFKYWIIKYVWIIIMLPKSLQLLIMGTLGILLICRTKLNFKFDFINTGLVLIFISHLVAIFYNLLVRQFDNERIFAAINTGLLWFLAACFYSYYKTVKMDFKLIGKYATLNILILFLFNCFSLYMYYIQGQITYKIGNSLLHTVVYLNGIRYIRFMGFMDYSNLIIEFMLVFFALSLIYVKELKWYLRLPYYFFSGIIVVSVHSRSGLIAFFAAVLVCFFIKYNKKYKWIFPVFLTVFTVFIIMNGSNIYNIFMSYVVKGNASSNSLRLLIYKESLEEVWNLSPIIGMGIKRYLIAGYPLGSHSTYIGLIYKCGIAGAVLGCFVFGKCLKNLLQNLLKESFLSLNSTFLISLIFLFALEDIDGANWLIITFFSVIGMLELKNKESSYE